MQIDHTTVAQAFGRHVRIAFHLSGGRDSVAALYALRALWDQMTVYHVDTGEEFPEIDGVLNVIRDHGVSIVTVYGKVQEQRRIHGLPADLVPAANTPMGLMQSARPLLLQNRYDCCARVLMQPMHERMLADGITLIVRGQRNDEFKGEPPLRSGAIAGPFEVLFPIEDWTAGDVMAFIKLWNLPLADFYRHGLESAPDCMGCTAWNPAGRSRYMSEQHPIAYHDSLAAIRAVQAEITIALES